MSNEAGAWWQALLGNDEQTVSEAVDAAFADNPAAGCAVGVQDGVLSVVMRQQDLDTLPDQTPGLTSTGRPHLKALTKRDRILWWLTIMGSNVIATVNEALATAPGISAVDVAVLSRIPDTQRLGVVAYGRWTRHAMASATWREPHDALRFLDIGEDVTCTVSTSSTRIRAVDTSRVPGLQALIDTAIEDGLEDHQPDPAPAPPDPYEIIPFSFTGADADMTLLLLGADGRVRSDAEFAFYNQPVCAHGAARLLGKSRHGPHTVERASVRLSALPHDVRRIVVSINMDADTGLTCAALGSATLQLTGPTTGWTIPTAADPQIRAMILAELYRHTRDGLPIWKLRAVGQGWADGLASLAGAHGVEIT